ncbi:MAG: amidohydrolase family protein [Candidatus Aminicenantaceae bacterium]
MKRNFLIMVIIVSSFTAAFSANSETIALVGGTVIDVSNFGNSHADIKDAVVLVRREKIFAVGSRDAVSIPDCARIIDAKGKYILPGLIDGFAALDNQAYANTYLYMGVTSIVGASGFRRSALFKNADPGPNIFLLGFVGKWKVTTEEMLNQIEVWAKKGVKFLILMYELRPEQLKLALKKAHGLGMAAIGELGYTSYREAIKYGIDAFIHSGRYSLDIAPPEIRAKVAAQPFGPPAREYARWLAGINPEKNFVQEYANILGSSPAALMPTLSLYCLDLPILDNPWEEPVAQILNPRDIHFPLDKLTGKHNFEPETLSGVIKRAENTLKIEKKYNQAGARYLAGSGTDVNGTMPGISLHQELELLTKIGLTERQALAAATSNFAEIFKWNEVGQIKSGCRADIIIVEKNPLENIKNLKKIHTVILNGMIISRKKLLKIK